MGLSPIAVAVSPDGSTVYVANADSDSISVVRVLSPAGSGTAALAATGVDGGSVAAGLVLLAIGVLALAAHRVVRAQQRTINAPRG